MRRHLLAAALCLAVAAAVGVETGMAGRVPPGCVSTQELSGGLLVTGQVYQKDEESIYLKSVIVSDTNASGQSAAGSLQEIQNREQNQEPNLNQQLNQNQEQHQIQEQKNHADSAREISVKENLICEVEQAQEIPLGSVVTLEGEFMPFSRATNPGEFDAMVYYRTLEIGGKLRKTQILSLGGCSWPVREGLYRLKSRLKERLCRIFPEREAAVMSALLLGDKKDLDSELKELYKRNGILHILSISSLHITILGMGVYRLMRRAGVPVAFSALGGSVLLVLYGCMTGFSVSACRAIGMYLIRMLGEVIGRTYDMLTALGLMGALMVLRNPFYLQNGGFLLSFASVLGLGVVFPALMPERLRRAGNAAGKQENGSWRGVLWEKLRSALYQSASASLSITLATLPVQLWFYYEIPVYSIFLNLLVIPLLKPMMITGLLALVPGFGILGWIGRCILGSYELLCACFDRLPFHTWNPGCPSAAQIAIYYLILLCAAAQRNHAKKQSERNSKTDIPVHFFTAGILCLAVFVIGFSPAEENSVTFLDVGQGDCILLRTASGQTYLFDCGSSSRSNVGNYVLLPYLKYNGIRYIDAVFLSHPDADHVNGALELLETGGDNGITVRQLLLPAIEEGARAEELGELLEAAESAAQVQGSPVAVGYLAAGDSWDCGSAVFTCLHPDSGFGAENANAYSECFYVEFFHGGRRGENASGGRQDTPQWTLLLTGDVEGRGEEALRKELAERGIGPVTVLKAAHHGSRNSTSEELLERLSPGLTVISCGRKNRYGHPHQELLERLEAVDTCVIQTAQSGAVTVRFHDGGLKVSVMLAGE